MRVAPSFVAGPASNWPASTSRASGQLLAAIRRTSTRKLCRAPIGRIDPAGERFGKPFLQRRRQAVDLVEHQRAAVAMLERADLAVEGAGKRALFMAEQHRFDRIRAECRARLMIRNGAFARGLARVHRAHQHFLAGAGFAFDQHMAMPARGLGGLGQRGAEGAERCRSSHRNRGVADIFSVSGASSSRGASRVVALRSACISRSGATGLTR